LVCYVLSEIVQYFFSYRCKFDDFGPQVVGYTFYRMSVLLVILWTELGMQSTVSSQLAILFQQCQKVGSKIGIIII